MTELKLWTGPLIQRGSLSDIKKPCNWVQKAGCWGTKKRLFRDEKAGFLGT